MYAKFLITYSVTDVFQGTLNFFKKFKTSLYRYLQDGELKFQQHFFEAVKYEKRTNRGLLTHLQHAAIIENFKTNEYSSESIIDSMIIFS